ncbi:MAG TPA: hypothetical protein VK781_08855 [Solirubrobacteraceae bacterium]|nr:hypothetical protein [Solirubrobacteraceae bacterium]
MDSGARQSFRDSIFWDDETLLEALADSLLGTGPGFGPPDIDRRIDFAQAWLKQRTTELRKELCGEVWSQLKHRGGFDLLSDSAIVADALAAVHGRPTANIVAVIMLRRGLVSLCEADT